MTKKVTNITDIILPVAALLAHDSYNNGSETVTNNLPVLSATTVIRPTRQAILTALAKETPQIATKKDLDVTDFIPSVLGRTFHKAVEQLWELPHKWKPALLKLGYPQHVIDRIVVNPEKSLLANPENNIIPVYVEGRTIKEFEGYNISGMYDMVFNGRLIDFKTTGTYKYVTGASKDGFIKQASIYRWLNPELITADVVDITYIFTDWQRSMSGNDDYPSHRVVTERYDLLSIPQIEAYMRERLRLYSANFTKPQSEMVRCTDDELWKRTEYRWYKDPNKALEPDKHRCSRNFKDDHQAALTHCLQEGGAIAPVVKKAAACNYCDSRHFCTQYADMLQSGEIDPPKAL